jgi:hypothetical protein
MAFLAGGGGSEALFLWSRRIERPVDGQNVCVSSCGRPQCWQRMNLWLMSAPGRVILTTEKLPRYAPE